MDALRSRALYFGKLHFDLFVLDECLFVNGSLLMTCGKLEC